MVRPSRAAFVLFAASPVGLHAIRTLKPSKHKEHKDASTQLSGDAEGLYDGFVSGGLWSSKAELQKAQAEYCSGLGLTDQTSLDSCMGMAQRARYMCDGIFTKSFEEGMRWMHKSGHDSTIKDCHLQPDKGQMITDCEHGHPYETCPLADMNKGDSHMVYLPKPAQCLFEGNQPAIQVIPGNTDAIMIVFQGGGICTDVAAVSAGLCCDRSVPVPQHGIYNHEHSDNPYAGFTIFIMPHCSGDANVGNVDHDKWVIRGRTGGVHQRGALNTEMALLYIQGMVGEEVKEAVVMGNEEGSATATMWAKDIFSVHYFPKLRASKLLLDGYPVLSKGVWANLLGQWKVTDALLPGELHRSYHDGTLMVEDVLNFVCRSLPKTLIQLISSKADTHAMDLNVVTHQWLEHTVFNHHTWNAFVFDVKPWTYYSNLIDAFYQIESGNGNFATFLIPGNSANHLTSSNLWESSSHGPIGHMIKGSTSLLDWLKVGAGLECVKIANVCEGPLISHYDHQDNDYGYCDDWLSSFEIVFNCPGEKPAPHVAPGAPVSKRLAASTTLPMEYPRELFAKSTTPLPTNSTEMTEEVNASSPLSGTPA